VYLKSLLAQGDELANSSSCSSSQLRT